MKIFTLIGLILLVGASATLFLSATTHANSAGWLSADPELVEYREFDQGVDAPDGVRHECTWQDVKVARVGTPGQFENKRLCVSQGKNFRLAQDYGYGYSYISIGLDKNFYLINISSWFANIHHLVGTDTVIFEQYGNNGGKNITSYDNFHTRLNLDSNQQYQVTNRDTDSKLTGGVEGQFAYGWGISKNGKYLVYGRGPNVSQNSDVDYFVLVDTETQQKKLFGKGFYLHYHRPGEPPEFVVSDDGKTVIATGYSTVKFWNITPDCLIDVPDMISFAPEPCEQKTYYPDFYHDQVLYPDSDRLLVDEDFTHIEYIYRPSNYTVKLRIPGYVAPTRLDYLALGDSYSSGQGDIERDANGQKYYRAGTDVNGDNTKPTEKCHISTRSYPYILSRGMDLTSDTPKQWETHNLLFSNCPGVPTRATLTSCQVHSCLTPSGASTPWSNSLYSTNSGSALSQPALFACVVADRNKVAEAPTSNIKPISVNIFTYNLFTRLHPNQCF